MKYAIITARALLALIFIAFSLNFWLHFINLPGPPPGSPAAQFMGVLFISGYLTAVKVLELLGGILVATGRFTSLGLLILGPIILNILFVDAFLMKGFNPLSTAAALLALFLLWTEGARFAPLVKA
jgi:uncharacterized membrane protein YphA (DoxX/SURF4 family)